MVKVSISLPNNAQITVESEEPDVIHEIVGIVLRDLPKDLMQAAPPVQGEATAPPATQKGSSVDLLPPSRVSPEPRPSSDDTAQNAESSTESSTLTPEDDGAEEGGQPPPERPQEPFSAGRQKAQQAARSAAAELAFVQFCQSVNPLGDMRKVVVAAEGAARFLEMDSVDDEELRTLFERVGWRQPHSFTQTLRNAARSKFRWLERVPGRSGHYTVSDLGRTTTLDN